MATDIRAEKESEVISEGELFFGEPSVPSVVFSSNRYKRPGDNRTRELNFIIDMLNGEELLVTLEAMYARCADLFDALYSSNSVIEKEDLIVAAFGYDHECPENLLHNYIGFLRKELDRVNAFLVETNAGVQVEIKAYDRIGFKLNFVQECNYLKEA